MQVNAHVTILASILLQSRKVLGGEGVGEMVGERSGEVERAGCDVVVRIKLLGCVVVVWYNLVTVVW